MRNFITLVWLLTPLSNAALCLLLLWRGWSARLQILTLWTGASVAADAIFWLIHAQYPGIYTQGRILAIYWFFNILMACAVWEAWRIGVRWLEYLISVQLFMSMAALFAHSHGDKWTVYYLECTNIIFNLLAIWYCILRFRGAPTYESRYPQAETSPRT